MERLIVEHLGPIEAADLRLRRINLFIGPQAGGKSTLAKAVYLGESLAEQLETYLDWQVVPIVFDALQVLAGEQDEPSEAWQHKLPAAAAAGFQRAIAERLQAFFPEQFWSEDTRVAYFFTEKSWVRIGGDSWRTGHMEWSTDAEALLSKIYRSVAASVFYTYHEAADHGIPVFEAKFARAEINELFGKQRKRFFVPAQRAMLIGELHGTMLKTKDLLSFEFLKKIENILLSMPPGNGNATEHSLRAKLIRAILQGEYRYVRGESRIYVRTDRYVRLEHASSGQQEVVWLLALLDSQIEKASPSFLAIEEPEAHLYPEAQKSMVELLSLMAHASDNQLIITTHSPYILSAFNNLLYAAQAGYRRPEQVAALVPRASWLSYEDIEAYFVAGGHIRSIMDAELQTIRAEEIDSASFLINQTYDQLLDIYHEDL